MVAERAVDGGEAMPTSARDKRGRDETAPLASEASPPSSPASELARLDARLQRIEATLARVERFGERMDAHISMVERMILPFQSFGRLVQPR